ncbi:general substrate transporter [Hyaloscypha variabilis]
MSPKKNRQTTWVTLFVAIGSIGYGYAASIIGQVLGQPQFFESFNLAQEGPGLDYTNAIIGAMNGIFFAGTTLGCLFIAWTATAFGRLRTIQIASCVCIFGAALMAGSINIPMYLASRFIMGWGVGMMVCGIPLYQAELSPPKSRGFHVGLHGSGLGCGYSLSGFTGFGCFYAAKSSFQWRFPFALQLVPMIILLCGTFFLPESPRWLLSNDRKEEAWKVIQRLHSDPNDTNDTFAKSEMYQMTEQFTLDNARMRTLGITKWWHFFQQPSYRKRLVVGVGATLTVACSMNLVMNNYQVHIYNQLGLNGGIPILLLAIWNVFGMLGNMNGAIILMDRFGRKNVFMLGIASTAACLAAEAALTKYFVQTGSTNRVGLGFGVFFIFLYVVFFASCMDAQQYVIVSETFPMEFRSIGVAISLAAQYCAAALFVGVAPISFANIGYLFYVVFVCLDVCTFLFVWKFIPEMKGLSLEEINELFGDPVAVHITHADKKETEEIDRRIENFDVKSAGQGEVTPPVHSENQGELKV